jgi:tRNA(Arg) A34 adenosine deaminase TadA
VEAKKEFMERAIQAAEESVKKGSYGIGAVVVKDNNIISVGLNTLKIDNDPVNGHPEIDAIRKACKNLKQPYLQECILYSTHEPCPMCSSAAIWAKMEGIVFGVSMEYTKNEMKKRMGGKFSWRQIDISCQEVLNKGEPKLKLIPDFLKEECIKLFDLTV